MRPRLLDLFCGQGGDGMGYHRAGFDVTGVDIVPQPRYPFRFWQLDALTLEPWVLAAFDAIHASPPCQAFTVYGNNRAHVRDDHPNLIEPTRELLSGSSLPYVIENVPRAPLRDPVRLCGTSLGLRVRRHRLFESSVALAVPPCDHSRFRDRIFPGSSNRPNGRTVCNVVEYRVPLGRQQEAMEMPWADLYGLSQAIPPAYTELIGHQLMQHVWARVT